MRESEGNELINEAHLKKTFVDYNKLIKEIIKVGVVVAKARGYTRGYTKYCLIAVKDFLTDSVIIDYEEGSAHVKYEEGLEDDGYIDFPLEYLFLSTADVERVEEQRIQDAIAEQTRREEESEKADKIIWERDQRELYQKLKKKYETP